MSQSPFGARWSGRAQKSHAYPGAARSAWLRLARIFSRCGEKASDSANDGRLHHPLPTSRRALRAPRSRGLALWSRGTRGSRLPRPRSTQATLLPEPSGEPSVAPRQPRRGRDDPVDVGREPLWATEASARRWQLRCFLPLRPRSFDKLCDSGWWTLTPCSDSQPGSNGPRALASGRPTEDLALETFGNLAGSCHGVGLRLRLSGDRPTLSRQKLLFRDPIIVVGRVAFLSVLIRS